MDDGQLLKVFIGSSTEGLPLAREIQKQLAGDCVPVIWNQGAFANGKAFIESLDQIARDYDCGIFVLTPDDVVTTRNRRHVTARDNLIFEFGLFIGRKGRERAFAIIPRVTGKALPFRLPSDLAGIQLPTYPSEQMEEDRRKGNLGPVLSPAIDSIRQSLQHLQNAPPAEAPINRLDRIVGQLTDVASGLVTNSLGDFPKYFPNILSLLENPTGNILIACDFLTYGIMSVPDSFDQYLELLRRAAGKTSVDYIFLNRSARRTMLSFQIGKTPKDFRKLRDKSDFEAQLAAFEKRCDRSLTSRVAFLSAVDEQQSDVEAKLKRVKSVRLYTTSRPLPLFSWIETGERAVFSLPRFQFGQNATEYGFATREPKLISSLDEMWRHLAKSCTAVPAAPAQSRKVRRR